MMNAEETVQLDKLEIQTVANINRNYSKEWIGGLLFLAAVIGLVLWLIIPGKASADPAVTTHAFEGGQLTWSISDYPAIVLGSNDFTIELRDSTGAAIEHAGLQVKLDMIGMVCGDYAFELKETSPGVYEGEGVPLMAGLWKATLTIHQGNTEATIVSRTLKAVY